MHFWHGGGGNSVPPMVKLGYDAYNIITTGDILFFAGICFTVCGALYMLVCFITDKASLKGVKKIH